VEEKKCNSKAIKNFPGKKLLDIVNICAVAAFSHTKEEGMLGTRTVMFRWV